MDKEFIPYEQALALKELGFDEPCLGFYNVKGLFAPDYKVAKLQIDNLRLEKCCLAPLYQQAFRLFREKYGLHSTIHLNSKGYFATITKKVNNLTPCIFSSEIFNAPEEAELECLKKLIEIVKEK